MLHRIQMTISCRLLSNLLPNGEVVIPADSEIVFERGDIHAMVGDPLFRRTFDDGSLSLYKTLMGQPATSENKKPRSAAAERGS